MIFPFLKGVLSPLKAPATFLIILFNIIIFIACFGSFEISQEEIEKILSDRELLQTQGLVFSQYIEAHSEIFQPLLRNIAKKSLDGDLRSAQQMGGLALRNSEFMSHGFLFKANGNEIVIEKWRSKFKEVLELQKNHPSYYLGLNYDHNSWVNWLSYQFTHSGFAHLFWNMIFLLMLGCFVESEVGSAVFVFTYLASGLIGAFAFSALSGLSAIPLVGASASISGLVGFTIACHLNKKVSFFFWLLPIQTYFGFTKLPAWILILIFCLPDLAGQLSSLTEFGSIAYSAHLGGAGCGLLVGVIYRWIFSNQSQRLSRRRV